MSDPQYENAEVPEGMTGPQTFNLLVVGVDLRLKDNVVQAIAIFVCLLLGAGIGAAMAEERLGGALLGGFFGMVIGLFGSGTFLMIYRLVLHFRGRHDSTP